jgi:outer membrane protein assembly factor BamB
MHAIPRRFPSGQLSIFATLLCLAVLAGCAPGATGPSPEQNCYPHSAPIPGPVVFHPTAGQAGLYVVARSGIYRFSSAGGALTPIWLYRMHGCAQLTPTVVGHIPGPLYGQPTIASDVTVAGGMIYFSAWETAGSWIDLYAVHADTGELVWKKRITDLSQIGGLLVLNNLLYIETGDAVHSLQLVNIIQALDVRDGSVRWTYRYSLSPDDTGMGLDSAGNGELYITGSHALFALDATNGQKLWQVNLPPGQNFPVASLLDGTVYVTSSAGCFNCVVQPGSSLVYAFDPATGTQRWQSQRIDGFLTPPMES